LKSLLPIFLALVSATGCPALAGESDRPQVHAILDYPRFVVNSREDRAWRLESFLQSTLDPSCLSNPQAKIVFQVRVSGHEIPHIALLRKSDATAADVFYCAQAIWEALPASVTDTETEVDYQAVPVDARKQMNSETKRPPNASFTHVKLPGLHPDDGLVKLHFIPASAVRRLGPWLENKDFETLEDTVSLSVKQTENPKLEQFRKEWFEFVDSHLHLNRAQLMDQVTAMKEKYRDLFRTES